MATTTTEGNEVQATAMAYTSPSRVTSYNPLSGLPANHATIQFSTFKRVKDALESIYKSLQDNVLEGNQYLVVLGLSDHALNKLKHEDHPLGMKNCRLELDANMAIIKVKPGYSHEVPLGVFTRLTDSKLRLMGLPLLSYVWARATTHEPTASMKAKEADESFHPESRLGNGNAAFPWPTLVIEIGNAQSLAKLREDVRWWFENSEGDVRIVLLMIVHQRSRTITLEKWQLAPPNTPPLTRAPINAFRQGSSSNYATLGKANRCESAAILYPRDYNYANCCQCAAYAALSRLARQRSRAASVRFSLYTSRACSYGAAYLAIVPLYSFYFFLYLYLWFFSVCGVDWVWIGEQGLEFAKLLLQPPWL
ncbi:hypothetical protein DTO271D3_4780 [Paecilomyces variotii]|nr:hypothetical protein DTO207G8_1549 [Paecilomyces variotii]KAJ9315041.1 hypothetical protein DTO271D3_4780 [Paecilomyces variotii]